MGLRLGMILYMMPLKDENIYMLWMTFRINLTCSRFIQTDMSAGPKNMNAPTLKSCKKPNYVFLDTCNGLTDAQYPEVFTSIFK